MAKRVFLIVLDSFGIGGAPDAVAFGDEGSNTLAAVLSYSKAPFPNLAKMGLLAIDGEMIRGSPITGMLRRRFPLPSVHMRE
jgi:phosphopentomutase